MGDHGQIEELLFNLLHNAIKFSNKNGTIAVSVKADGTVAITDHGIGIAKEKLPHIFDRFYTSDSARDERGVRGAGLGLSIVRDIVNAHHARISFKSELGIGTTVTVLFSPHSEIAQ
jgi:signal transduction histidine kinase